MIERLAVVVFLRVTEMRVTVIEIEYNTSVQNHYQTPINDMIYRAVHKKCPGEHHIVEPHGFFSIERASVLVGN